MILPPPFCMCGIACLVQKKTPFTLMPRTLSHSSSVISWVGLFTPAIPALFTSTSSLPKPVCTSANTVFTSFSSVTSRCRKSALPPLLRISSTSFFPFASEMSVTTAMAPSFASKRQAARPIPWAPPVTMATLSFTLFIMPIRSHVLSVQSQCFPLCWSSRIYLRLDTGCAHRALRDTATESFLGFIFVSILAVLTGRCVIPQPNHFQVHHGLRHLQSKVSRGGSDYV